jgi:glycosyltransferase involved in cell wall biosynthesis
LKKLLVFTENYLKGGGNRYLIDIVNAFALKYDSATIAYNNGGIFPEDLKRLRHNIELLKIPFYTMERARNALLSLPRLMRRTILMPIVALSPILFIYNLVLFVFILAKVQPSAVLCCNGGYPAARGPLVMVLASKLLRVPALLSIISMPTPRSRLLSLYERALDYLVWQSTDAVIVNAHAIARALQEKRGISLDKVHVIYNGLEIKEMSGKGGQGEKLRIGCVARMDHAKGVLYLLDAFAKLARKYQQLQLVLVGDGDAFRELCCRTEQYDLSDRVEMFGYFQGSIDEVLCSLDIYLFPSLWEGFPYSIIEAMRAGCTIISTRVGGIPEAIRDGEDGLLIDPASTAAIADAIEKLIPDPNLRARLAASARKRFTQKFSLASMEVNALQVLAKTGIATRQD